MHYTYDLAVIVPVYNEAEIIRTVLNTWTSMLDSLDISYVIRVYNDGSRDGSLDEIRAAAGVHDRITAIDKPNSGHGPTILRGYRESGDAEWIFQMDADNEISCKQFPKFWSRRQEYDFMIGSRENRTGSLSRQGISLVSRLVVRAFYGAGISDANAPYRLMRTSMFNSLFATIPADTFAPNVIVSGMALKKRLRVCEIAVPFESRKTGKPSLFGFKLFKNAVKSFIQVIAFRFA